MRLVIGNKNSSSWSLRPWIGMRVLGIPFEEVRVNLRQPGTAAEIARYSPSGKVPCLIDGDTIVWETIAILEYLADNFPDKGIWPKDAAVRAHARAISAEMHAGFQPLRSECGMSMAQVYAAKQRSAGVLANAQRIMTIWGEARAKFADASAGPFLYGAFSGADAMFAPVVSRIVSYGLDVDPVSRAYISAVSALPAYREWRKGAAAEPWSRPENDGEVVVENLAVVSQA